MKLDRTWGLALLATISCTAKAPDEPDPRTIRAEGQQPENPTPRVEPPLDPPPPPPAAAPMAEPVKRACTAKPRPRGTLELVRQVPLESPPEFFSPDGRFAAMGSCEVWELDGGVYLGSFGDPRASGDCVTWPTGENPCADWLEAITLDLDAIAPLRGTTTLGATTLQFERGRFDHPNASVGSPEQPLFAAALDSERARVALASEREVVVLALPDGERLATLSLGQATPPSGDIWKLALWWAGPLPIALIGRETTCDNQEEDCPWGWNEPDEAVWELRRWTSLRDEVGKSELVTWEGEDDPGWVIDAVADPLGRWLWVTLHSGVGHDMSWEQRQIDLTPEAERLGLDLYVEGIDGSPSPTDNRLGAHEDAEVEATWLSGPRTARFWVFTDDHYDGEGSGSHDLLAATMQLWPRPAAGEARELGSDFEVEEQGAELLGVADERSLIEWSQCWPNTELERLREDFHIEDVGEDHCKGERPVPSGCEARGADDRLDWLLIQCTDEWSLLPVGPAAEVLERKRIADAKTDGPVTAVVGRSGLAIAGERSGLRLLAPDASPRAVFPGVARLIPALLGPEIDRVLGRTQTGLEVFDLATGTRTATVTVELGEPGITHAAFAPDGQRLAWTDGQSIHVWTLADAKIRSWPAGSVLGLAWRQDGAVLFSGKTRALPELAWDPSTGTLASTQPDPAFLVRLADASLDPSWRWAFEDDDVILRTLDGLALYLEDDGWVATETGLYDGPDEPSGLFVRVVGDTQARVLALSGLAQLRRPGLLARYLAGEPLPEPRLEDAESATLD